MSQSNPWAVTAIDRDGPRRHINTCHRLDLGRLDRTGPDSRRRWATIAERTAPASEPPPTGETSMWASTSAGDASTDPSPDVGGWPPRDAAPTPAAPPFGCPTA